jgi:uncharacterized protein YbjQ (UPF0145 family)
MVHANRSLCCIAMEFTIMRMSYLFLLGILMFGAGCSPVSSSNAVPASPARESAGRVVVSQDVVPTGIEYKVLGEVKANFRAGYDSAESLYPLLAAEAKKLGANAVVNVKGGRRVTAFSWSAAYVSGTAIRVGDPESLRRLSGSSY